MSEPGGDLVPTGGDATANEPAGGSVLPAASVDEVAMLTAALRADLADLETYSRVLASSITESLPAGVIEIERDRTLADRVAHRPGAVRVIRVNLGEDSLELTAQRSTLVATVTRNVRGVAISRREVPIDEWTQRFATALSRFATENAAARAALQRLLEGSA